MYPNKGNSILKIESLGYSKKVGKKSNMNLPGIFQAIPEVRKKRRLDLPMIRVPKYIGKRKWGRYEKKEEEEYCVLGKEEAKKIAGREYWSLSKCQSTGHLARANNMDIELPNMSQIDKHSLPVPHISLQMENFSSSRTERAERAYGNNLSIKEPKSQERIHKVNDIFNKFARVYIAGGNAGGYIYNSVIRQISLKDPFYSTKGKKSFHQFVIQNDSPRITNKKTRNIRPNSLSPLPRPMFRQSQNAQQKIGEKGLNVRNRGNNHQIHRDIKHVKDGFNSGHRSSLVLTSPYQLEPLPK